MKVVRLEIEQQRAEINVEIQRAQLHVEMPDRKMDIEQVSPEMEVRRENGEVRIDMDAFRSNLGLKSTGELTREAAARARAESLRGIRESVNTAAFVGDVTISGDKIGMAARDKLLEFKDPSPGRSPVPPSTDMTGIPGETEIEWSRGDLSIEWEGAVMPEVYVEPPGSVEVSLSERASVSVTLVEESIPPASGRNVSVQI